MALAIRFITGSVNGVMGVSKTYLAEVCDESNQARGFSILGLNRALGLIVGPVVGGFLSQPSQKYPSIFPPGSFFDRNPYSLPCIIAFIISVFGNVMAYFVLEETLIHQTIESEPLLTHESSIVTIEDENDNTSHTSKKPASILILFQDKAILTSILLYAVIQSYYISFVLWARLPRAMGGIEWGSSQIGSAFSFGGIILLVYQGFIYHIVERRFGALASFRAGVLLTIPCFIILPRSGWVMADNIPDASDLNSDTWIVWTLVFFCQGLRSISSLQAFTSCFIMIANSAPAEIRGSVNGFAQSLGSFSQLLGPIIGGYLFSASLTTDYLGGVTFLFSVLVGCALVAFSCSLLAPKSVDKRRAE